MKRISRFSRGFCAILLVGLLSGALLAGTANAAPPNQDPRPPVDTGGGGNGGGGNGGGGGGGTGGNGGNGNGNGNGFGGAFSSQCAALTGQVINWGVGGIGGVGVELMTGSWQASSLSSADGVFAFGGLGTGPATLQVAVAPELADDLQPHIQDAGIYLNCQFPIIANIAVFGDMAVEPPATIEMTASNTSVEPGDEVDFELTVENDLPNQITNAIVTVSIPPGLIPVDVSAPVGRESIIIADTDQGGKLVVVNLDEVESGAAASIEVNVVAGTNVESAELTSTAALFYRESIADQTSLELTVEEFGAAESAAVQATTTAGETGSAETSTPDSEALPTAETASAEIGEISPESETADDGEGFVPPGGLPGSGGDVPDSDDRPVTSEIYVLEDDLAPTRVDFLPAANITPAVDEAVIQSRERFTYTGLDPLLPLAGLVLAGFVFAAHHLYESRRSKD